MKLFKAELPRVSGREIFFRYNINDLYTLAQVHLKCLNILMNRQQTPEAHIILLEKNTEYRYFI